MAPVGSQSLVMDTGATVQEQLKRRGRLSHFLSIAGALALGMARPPRYGQAAWSAPAAAIHVSIAAAGLLALAVAWLSYRRIRCPWCHRALFSFVAKPTFAASALSACPSCGANFMQPMPDVTQSEAQHITTPDQLQWK